MVPRKTVGVSVRRSRRLETGSDLDPTDFLQGPVCHVRPDRDFHSGPEELEAGSREGGVTGTGTGPRTQTRGGGGHTTRRCTSSFGVTFSTLRRFGTSGRRCCRGVGYPPDPDADSVVGSPETKEQTKPVYCRFRGRTGS